MQDTDCTWTLLSESKPLSFFLVLVVLVLVLRLYHGA